MPRSAFGHVRERDNGTWQARYQTPDGRQHSKSFRTKDDAARWLRGEADRIDRGEWVDRRSGRITLADWRVMWWDGGTVHLRDGTRQRDLEFYGRYIGPVFGQTRLADIDQAAVDRWVVDLSGRLSPATVHKAKQVFSKIMAGAVRARRIAANPVDGVRLPKIEQEEMRFLTPADIASLELALDPRWQILVRFGATSGLRAGEMFGLRVGRVSPAGMVDVVESLNEGDVGPVKTRAGRRRVQLPPSVASLVAAHTAGRPADSFVFEAPNGGPIRRRSWESRFWRPAVAAAHLDGLRLHDLRHTAVALWIAAGATPVEIARRAGHSSVSVVLDRYGHLLPGADDRLASALDLLLPSAT